MERDNVDALCPAFSTASLTALVSKQDEPEPIKSAFFPLAVPCRCITRGYKETGVTPFDKTGTNFGSFKLPVFG